MTQKVDMCGVCVVIHKPSRVLKREQEMGAEAGQEATMHARLISKTSALRLGS